MPRDSELLVGARVGARLAARGARLVCALALVGGALVGCPGPAAELRIDLVRGEGAALENLGALRFVVRNLEEDAPEVYGPIALEGDRRYRLAATVTPGVDFYVDVLGCTSATTCDGEAYVARGCTSVLNISTDTAVTIALFDREQPDAAACPPRPRVTP